MRKIRQIAAVGKTQLTCFACGGQFWRSNSHIRNTTHSCSRKCAGIAKAKRPIQKTQHICLECKTVFTRRLGSGGKKRFCSVSCARKGAPRTPNQPGTMPQGENHHRWKGGISKRPHSVKIVTQKRIAEEGRCERCGSIKNLQGHHRKSYAETPELRQDPSNIEVLCATCHAAEHPALAPMILRPRIKTGTLIACENCGSLHYVRPSRAASARFCSHECQRTVLHNLTRERHRLGIGFNPHSRLR